MSFLENLRGGVALLFVLGLSVSGCSNAYGTEVSLSRNGFTQADVACMAEALYFEARGTGEEGRRAVGEVILNRVTDPRFPGTVCAVVDDNCQFSYRCDHIPNNMYNDSAARGRALDTALTLLTEQRADITSGALFFHSERMRPTSWFQTLPRVGTFGGNVFYRST
ncbi:MAG: cell wall hydrolase [Paracoccaceae bacterium]